jgi:hypothetical protein
VAILKRFICSKHGEFDAWSDAAMRCPAARCRCKPREMVAGPAVHRGATASKDKTLKQLAMDFNMTNMKSAREGEAQSGYLARNNAPAPKETRPGDAVMWGGGGRFALDNVVKNGNGVRSIAGEPTGATLSGSPKLRPSWVMKDPDNLQIKR